MICRSALTLLAATSFSFAGQPDLKEKIVTPATAESVPLTLLSFKSSYVFESDFERGKNASGDAWFNGASVAQRFPISLPWPSSGAGDWYFRLGAEYGRYDFNNAGSLPLPGTLQNTNAVLALEYLVKGEIAILLETSPGFYFENDLGGDSFDAPTKAAMAFPLSERLYLIAGATYRGQFEKIPVLPALGVLWFIDDQWTLQLLAPSPRLIYRPLDNLRLWVGGELSGGSYRTDDDQARPEKLRGAALAYSEYKAGVGFTWGDPNRTALDVGAGYAFQRKFDYHRAEEGYETDGGAPYVRVSFRTGF